MNNSTPIISLSALTFTLAGNKQPFFKDLSIEFKPGVFHRIKGKNGVGKSLFFRIIQAQFFQNEKISGTVSLTTKSYNLSTSLPLSYSEHIAALPQKFDLVLADSFSGEDNLRCANIGTYPLFFRSLVTIHFLIFLLNLILIYTNRFTCYRADNAKS